MFQKLVTKTAINYLMVVIGALVIGRFGIDETNWHDITAIVVNTVLPAALALYGAGNGIIAAAKPKVVGSTNKALPIGTVTADRLIDRIMSQGEI